MVILSHFILSSGSLLHGSGNRPPFLFQLSGSYNHPTPHSSSTLRGRRLLMGENLVVVRTWGVWYGWSMDTGTQLTMLGSGNSTLEEAFRVFCDVYMPRCQFTETTQRGYRYDLREWLSQIAVIQVKSVSGVSIKHYLSHLDERGLKDSIRKRKAAAISTFLRF